MISTLPGLVKSECLCVVCAHFQENAEQELSAARAALARLMDPNANVQTPVKPGGSIAFNRGKRKRAAVKNVIDDWSDRYVPLLVTVPDETCGCL